MIEHAYNSGFRLTVSRLIRVNVFLYLSFLSLRDDICLSACLPVCSPVSIHLTDLTLHVSVCFAVQGSVRAPILFHEPPSLPRWLDAGWGSPRPRWCSRWCHRWRHCRLSRRCSCKRRLKLWAFTALNTFAGAVPPCVCASLSLCLSLPVCACVCTCQASATCQP